MNTWTKRHIDIDIDIDIDRYTNVFKSVTSVATFFACNSTHTYTHKVVGVWNSWLILSIDKYMIFLQGSSSQHDGLRVTEWLKASGTCFPPSEVFQLRRQKLHHLLWPKLRSPAELLLLHSVGYKWASNLSSIKRRIRFYLLEGKQ